ncbi:MAG: porin family protein [Rhodospirillaceae bacterium]|jgi:OmpA-OmpF porin, OOP family|nr:porin family protein [Rhodospirillaceae bacterium]MBT6118712.1 porin family protein [Rhodospirillaceae bacterium]
MKTAISFAFFAALVLAANAAWAAGPPTLKGSYYLSLFGMWEMPQTAKVSRGFNGESSLEVKPDAGFGGGGAIGHKFDDFRLEIQAAYSTHDINEASELTGANQNVRQKVAATGTIEMTTLMVNGIYDIPGSPFFTPYIGAGAGAAFIKADNVRLLNGGQGFIDDSTTAPAFQGLAGFAVALTDNVAVDLGYAFLYVSDPSATITGGRNDGISDTVDNAILHRINLGLRYSF